MYRSFHTSWSSQPTDNVPAQPLQPVQAVQPVQEYSTQQYQAQEYQAPQHQAPQYQGQHYPQVRQERPVSITDQLQAMSSIESIADARSLLVRMLQDSLRLRIHNTLTELFEVAQQLGHGQEVKAFQERLKDIEHWNARIVEAEAAEIRQLRPDLEEVITGAFVATFMVLASVRGQNDDEVRVRVPSAEAFIHDCYILVAQEMFSSPFLYTNSDQLLFVDYRNRALDIIDRCVEAVVLQRISVQQVMRFPSSVPPRQPLQTYAQYPPAQPLPPPLAPTKADVEPVVPEDSVSQRSNRSRQDRSASNRSRSIQLRSTAKPGHSGHHEHHSPSRSSKRSESLQPKLR